MNFRSCLVTTSATHSHVGKHQEDSACNTVYMTLLNGVKIRLTHNPMIIGLAKAVIEPMNCFNLSFGAPEETRTPDLLIRSQTLYPAELPAHVRSLERKIYNTILFKKKQVFFEKLIHLSD